MIEIRLDAFAHLLQDLPADFNAVIVVLDGEGIAGADRKSIVAGDVAWLTRRDREGPSTVAIAAGKGPLRALLYAGRPLREPVVAGGPFIMNTQAEIEQAYADYRAGRFGPP
jgi:redox-sensitive bicupin YhaK (pirin superfamily)